VGAPETLLAACALAEGGQRVPPALDGRSSGAQGEAALCKYHHTPYS
jgi:hypothetical protein